MKKWFIRLPLLFISLLFLLVLLLAGAFRIVNQSNGALLSSGETRRYLLYIPDSYDPSRPAPLVISLHGFSEWPAHQMHISGWNELADQYGFIVVYPSGTQVPLRWRLQDFPGDQPGQPIDVAFITDLIDHLSGVYNLDPARIYVNGLSNGGGMSYELSCFLSERIAAIGSVAGAYLLPVDQCHPSRPVPAILFHGTADRVVPYFGGPGRAFRLPFPSIPEFALSLAESNGCPTPAQAEQVSQHVLSQFYSGCTAPVILYTIQDGGHTWPGGESMPALLVGQTTSEIDATRLMWDFFQQHPLP